MDSDDTTVKQHVVPVLLREVEQLWVLVVSGPAAGHWHHVTEKGALIGRQRGLEIAIEDPGISRRHAAIARTAGSQYVIRDLGSSNGLFVAGVRVHEHVLGDGDQIQLSDDTMLRVRYAEPAEIRIIGELQDAAMTDPLTGVTNRRYLFRRLDQELAYAHRHSAPLSVLLIDLDGFKPINDKHGHASGDVVLQAVARLLARTMRVEDVLARCGGDEFAVVVRGSPPQTAAELARRLCQAVRTSAIACGPEQVRLTLSIGVAGVDGSGEHQDRDPMNLLGRADLAMYRAKQAGKDRFEVWSERLSTPTAAADWLRNTRPTSQVHEPPKGTS